ncbi:SpoIIE family protein phosphatase [Streptomyces rapamycinicus]|uniref:Signal transduction histidine kinase n=2 Tax=Streptomyces rapamycinicus TaxID=1226757 RepID=A0A0A0NAC0_STRRN|nr:SpoIIE family protein phosphatase [Streptomyces rapamycinicus]AGP54236.1 magnesium or manganese-dependent protein phosphatase [Streptomyces rapamycinicus NRRL 5491]MBB4781737.1 serine phosphatase RsbU (regulator of sigma subunit)/anti-sigma regulatory factor (Ser/Thr protein kinase) [Streptomyces rapamycinicus]RLV73621.1 signal transduction histidine kinase [Streptomyces rapamycinicus NRRL 5491]UTO62311.1 SpoIIE family protein phosphatase [Streptomyces rapamycinicus]UTP30266.1 SpoIIE family
MEYGTSRCDDGQGEPPVVPEQRRGVHGRMPLAVVVIDAEGRVTHWSSGARRLFGATRQQAVGRPAVDLMPVSGALRGAEVRTDAAGGPELDDSRLGAVYYPTAGRARMAEPGHGRVDVLWWAYPLVGPGPERLLVLAADAQGVGGDALGRDERIGPGFALHTEFPGAERLAGRLPDILPNMGPATAGRIVAQVLELGYPVLEISHHERVPVTPDWGMPRYRERRARQEAVRRSAIAADGALDRAHAPERSPDPDEVDLEYAAVRERLEFLNEVSGRIGTSLDLARTIREVTSAAVPRFADFAGTHLRAQVLAGEGFPDGPPDITTVWHRVWVEHNDEPGRWDDTVPVGESIAFPEHTPFFQCMVTGEPVLIPHISAEVGDRIAGQFEKRDLRPLINGRSILIVPLKARDVVLGFMVLLRRPGREPFDDMDRTTGAELAARAGLVLDNARMYTYQENVAETLQDSMLPQVTPRMAGCDTATRYLPGTRLGRVGGDWFDTIKLPGSRTALVVGDVMGHGLTSAAMMGQLRTAVQTMAALDLPPAQLLRNLDDLAQRLGEHYLATCLYAVYDPVTSELVVSNAGHIPPVLVRARDGRSELLDLPTGAPIGVGGVPFETVTVRVAPGDRLVLCTDGLVEVRGQDIGAGIAALCESAAHPAASMDAACDTIIRALAAASRDTDGRGGRKDDVALLMARLNGVPAEDVAQWRLALDPGEVGRARRLVRERLLRWGLPEAVETAELLVSEAVTNAIRHAHTHHVRLRLVRTDALLCEVTDDDHELPALLSADRDDESGRGLRVISKLAREWGTSRTGRGKTVWFEQALAHPAEQALTHPGERR